MTDTDTSDNETIGEKMLRRLRDLDAMLAMEPLDSPLWAKVDALIKIRIMSKTHVPYCGHPACNRRVSIPSIKQDESDGNIIFMCRDMGHWAGTQDEVRWVPKGEL